MAEFNVCSEGPIHFYSQLYNKGRPLINLRIALNCWRLGQSNHMKINQKLQVTYNLKNNWKILRFNWLFIHTII